MVQIYIKSSDIHFHHGSTGRRQFICLYERMLWKYHCKKLSLYDITLDPVMVAAGATIAKPDDPTVPGYEFKGWFKDFNCEYAWDFDNDRVDKDIVLFPKWESIPTENPGRQRGL